jgi:hypothetical protein
LPLTRQESGADPAAVPTWRRKLVWFSGDSQRPPFYGSRKPRWAASAAAAAPRPSGRLSLAWPACDVTPDWLVLLRCAAPPLLPACSPAVGPRKYLGRDEAVDYEVMSDLEWEEEPQDGELALSWR